MNVLFYRYNSVYEPDMIAAFKQAGLNVIEIDREITDKDITDRERIRLVSDAIEAHKPVFVYGVNYYPAISEVCRIFNVIYVSQTVDSPVFTLFDRAQYDLFSSFNKDGVIHMPLASAVERFDKVISSINDDDRRKFTGDISFVGSTYREKDPYFKLTGLSDY